MERWETFTAKCKSGRTKRDQDPANVNRIYVNKAMRYFLNNVDSLNELFIYLIYKFERRDVPLNIDYHKQLGISIEQEQC